MFISLALFVIVVVLSAMPTSRLTVAADKRMFLYGEGQGLSSRGFCNTCYITYKICKILFTYWVHFLDHFGDLILFYCVPLELHAPHGPHYPCGIA